MIPKREKLLKVKSLFMVIIQMQITLKKKLIILNKENMTMVKKMKKMIVIIKNEFKNKFYHMKH